MANPKILVMPGSTREGSFNSLLANAAVRSIEACGGAATLVNLADYPMDFVDGGNSSGEMPSAVAELHAKFAAHDGILLITPEYNSFPSPLLLNALDWLSRVRHYEGGMDEVFGRPLYAVCAASPSPIGGYRALMALRQKLGIGLGATVIPAMAHIAAAYEAFYANGELKSDANKAMLDKVVNQLCARLGA
ncbi:oxidoreductase [Novosphingobium endophyticum]|uniref:Oxidoreductase n=1 Tax=Novosphingobium endophyticum TaxID=1955250 RepID=A0A916TSB3_9SPHN|nr:NAD(P)H-dependent oxidoreductase [Novosphingobium endophyticum]GGC01529.1 oxidoreductase [Novosphingobium endophyticum]